VDKRDFETALESPELVGTPDVQRQFAFRYPQIHQGEVPFTIRSLETNTVRAQ
jgi:hypothetical protein